MNVRRNILHYLKFIGLIAVVIMIRLSFKNGDGQDLYPNGQPKSTGGFLDGKADGTWTWWYEDGTKMTEGTFIDGKRSGRWSTWYPNGNKKSAAMYAHDQLNGSYLTWYESGNIKYRGFYKADKPDSVQFYYDSTGAVTDKKIFLNGVLAKQ